MRVKLYFLFGLLLLLGYGINNSHAIFGPEKKDPPPPVKTDSPAPFQKGQYLIYTVRVGGFWGKRKFSIRIDFKEGEGTDLIAHYAKIGEKGKKLSSQKKNSKGKKSLPRDVATDRFGRDEKGQFVSFFRFPLWLPVDFRKKGKKILEDKFTLSETGKWKGWKVHLFSGKTRGATVKTYYHREKGFLVGSKMAHMVAALTFELTETNIKGLLPD